MSFQIRLFRKALVTAVPVTGIRLLPGVDAFVFLDQTFEKQRWLQPSQSQDIRLLSRVGAFVRFQMTFLRTATGYSRPSHRHKASPRCGCVCVRPDSLHL